MKRHASLSLEQAALQSPTLARLIALADESNQRLAAVRHLLPAALQSQVRAGPLDDSHWCLLVPSSAAAAKLRQLLPSLSDALASRGWKVTSIRLKVQA